MASSKREEERNEKIIRGLMKLPPNRRCINCNNLGPQYVCSNFWTFVCMICSGIHREFTHRVKSVSMSKFTSQEVEALQNGGNQRAREIYLKDWDMQRQRQPNSSDVDKVREFIKAVYVDRKYAGGNKSEKPLKDSQNEGNTVDEIRRASSYQPNSSDVDKVREFIKAVYVDRKYAGGNKSEKPLKDSQNEGNTVDEIRRASSYHSYSQSPPYDFQYEDRLNRKQGSSLSKKPGSDRGFFGRKTASFVFSPGRFSDHLSEDRFANEGSSSRVSDYSVSSGGDQFRSAPQSPNMQRDDEFSSPTLYSSKDVVDGLQYQTRNAEVSATRDADKVPLPRPQRTVSSGSFGLFDKNSGSLQSVGHATDSADQSLVSSQDKLSSFAPHSQAPAENSAPIVDYFQAPTSSVGSIDLFQIPGNATGNPAATNLKQELAEQVEPSNDGWATFDMPQHIEPAIDTLNAGMSEAHSKIETSFKNLDPVSSSNTGLPWLAFQSTPVDGFGPSVSNPWTESVQNTHVATSIAGSQPWNAFGEAEEQQRQRVNMKATDLQVPVDNGSSIPNLFTQDSATDGLQTHASTDGFSFPNLSSHFGSGLPFNQPIHPFMNDVANLQHKSSNPFDIPFDSGFEVSNVFLDMNSLQAGLPITTHPSPYAAGLNDSWFPSNPMGSQGGMSYVAAQPPSSHLPNVPPTHGPAASVGGNPFA